MRGECLVVEPHRLDPQRQRASNSASQSGPVATSELPEAVTLGSVGAARWAPALMAALRSALITAQHAGAPARRLGEQANDGENERLGPTRGLFDIDPVLA